MSYKGVRFPEIIAGVRAEVYSGDFKQHPRWYCCPRHENPGLRFGDAYWAQYLRRTRFCRRPDLPAFTNSADLELNLLQEDTDAPETGQQIGLGSPPQGAVSGKTATLQPEIVSGNEDLGCKFAKSVREHTQNGCAVTDT